MEYSKDFPKILLFEPDAEVCELLRSVLNLLGYDAEIVADPARLLLRIGENPVPRLLIAGYRIALPKGSNLLDRLRARGSRLPVILVGGETTATWDSEAWRPDRVTVRIGSPVSIDDLAWVVRRILEKE